MGKDKGKGGGGPPDKIEHKLQAVLLADSFNFNFRPVSYDTPKVLCPLVNVPMIDYTLELLATNGVEEVLVFCASHAEAVEEYISSQTRWANMMEVRCITSSSCCSGGDALRELDQMGVIHSDPFILISGDVVSNVDLKAVIQRHKESRRKSHGCIMTMTFAPLGCCSALRPVLDDLVVGLSDSSSQVVMYGNNGKASSLLLPSELFDEHDAIEVRDDLLDCQIDVCSPEVLVQVSDNFDYQDLRQDFITNEVANYEMGNKIMGYITAKKEYSVRVQDFRLYHAVSMDLITRWCYPLTPDNGTTGGTQTTYTFSPGYIYREDGVTLPRSTKLGRKVVLAAGVSFGENCVIEDSIIGRNCKVGDGVVIRNSYLWEGAIIGDDATLNCAIVCHGAVVSDGATMKAGSILGPAAVLGEAMSLGECCRITCSTSNDDWGDDSGFSSGDEAESEAANERSSPAMSFAVNTSVLGLDGRGRVWHLEDEEGDDISVGSDMVSFDIDVIKAQSIGCTEELEWRKQRWCRVEETGENDTKGDPNMFEQEHDASLVFHTVVKDMVLVWAQEKHPIENLLLEIKGYKFAQNRSFEECVRAVTEAALDLSCQNDLSGMALVGPIKQQFVVLKSLIQSLCVDEGDGVAMMVSIEEYAFSHAKLASVFRYVLQVIYDMELVSQEDMEEWIDMRKGLGREDEAGRLFWEDSTQEFVEWLGEETEEDDSEDESEDE